MDEICGGREENEQAQTFDLQINSEKYYTKGEALLHAPLAITNKLKDILLETDKVYFVGQTERSQLRKVLQLFAFLLFFSLILSFLLSFILGMSTHLRVFYYYSAVWLLLAVCFGGVLYNARRLLRPVDNYVCITDQHLYSLSVQFDGETSLSLSPLHSLSYSLLLKVDHSAPAPHNEEAQLGNPPREYSSIPSSPIPSSPLSSPLSSPPLPSSLSSPSSARELIYDLKNDLYLEMKGGGGMGEVAYIEGREREEVMGRLQSLFNTYRYSIASKSPRRRLLLLLLLLSIALALSALSLFSLFSFHHSLLPFSPIFLSISFYFFALIALALPDLLRKRVFVIYF